LTFQVVIFIRDVTCCFNAPGRLSRDFVRPLPSCLRVASDRCSCGFRNDHLAKRAAWLKRDSPRTFRGRSAIDASSEQGGDLGDRRAGPQAVQCAKAMGLNVLAVDIDDARLTLTTELGAALTVKALHEDPAAFIKKEIGGAQGVLVTAVSPKAFQQAMGMVPRGSTVSLNGLPPGDFPLSIFDAVLNGITVRGSTRSNRSISPPAARCVRP
jgi:hypothetical protein